MRNTIILALAAVLASPAFAQVQPSEPAFIETPTRIMPARDIDYPGMLTIDIDATDTARGISACGRRFRCRVPAG